MSAPQSSRIMDDTEKVFLGLGECMVEMAPTGSAGHYAQGFAGDVFNTLWYAARSFGPGWRVRFISALGTDPLSDELVAFARMAGVDCRAVLRLEGAMPGLYLIRLVEGERRFLYWRGQSAARRMMQDPGHVARQMSAASVMYLSGITLAILPPDHRGALIELMGAAHADGKLVVFDPNIRPALWEDAKTMRATLTAAAGAAGLLLPSFDDEAAAFGDATPEATARRFEAAGCAMVVVKNAAAPVMALSGGRLSSYETPALKGPVVDTTAAGDAFNAAFLASFLRDRDIGRAVGAGQALAASVVQGRGALVESAVFVKGTDP